MCADQDDGDLCNGTPFCNLASGKCQNNPATAITCPTVDDTACHQKACDKATGACVWQDAAPKTACNDGNPCTTGESCSQGVCSGGAQSCGCKTNADCAVKEDGDACNGTLYCDLVSHACAVNPATVIQCPQDPDAPCKLTQCQKDSGDCAVQLAVEGTPCNDGQPCTEGDACKAGVCEAGPFLACPCLADKDCDKFEDANLCNGTLYCDTSAEEPRCVVNPATEVTCTTALDTACVAHVCQKSSGQCAKVPAAEGAACDDGDPCTGPDGCKAAACFGATLSCDDGDGCTIDSCSPAAGGCLHAAKPCADDNPCTADGCAAGVCTHTAISGGCDDGDACTHTDQCGGGVCLGSALDCDDDNACSADDCAADKGCVHLPLSATACDDGDACSVGDSCKQGTCVGGAGPTKDCSDASPCTIDTCIPAAGCVHFALDNLPCNDGDACTKADACAKGSCSGAALAAGACDDDNPCTDDGCKADSGCTHKANAASCDDGDPCTTGEACKDSQCVPAQVLPCECSATQDCAAKDNDDLCDGALICDKSSLPWRCKIDPLTVVTCDTKEDGACEVTQCLPATGKCKQLDKADEASCSPGDDACVGGKCVFGICIPTGKSPDCDDGNTCTADQCSPASGCANLAAPLVGKACDDGDACTAGAACVAGSCAGGKELACDDGNACTVDVCLSQQGCSHKSGLLEGKKCDDGDACSAGDSCVAELCKAVTATDCGDGNACTVDLCHSSKGCLHDPDALDGVGCKDADACTTSESCTAGVCASKAADCDDDNPCTVDGCSAAKGCTHAGDALAGKPCVHPAKCATNTSCKAGVCGGGDSSKCGNLGDCGLQPDSLFVTPAQASGVSGFGFAADGRGFALAEGGDGKVSAMAIAHPLAKPWSPSWSLTLGQTAAPSPRLVAAPTADGGLILGGGKATLNGGVTTWASWLRRVDSKGLVLWSDKPTGAAAPLRDVIALADGTYASVASVTTSGRSVVVHFTASGNTIWQRSDKGPSGSASVDIWSLGRLAGHPDGGLIAVGSVDKPTAAAGVQAMALAVRYNATGTSMVFSVTVPSGWRTRWSDVVVLADGSLRLVGEQQSGANAALRPWHALLSKTGQVLSKGEVLAKVAERALDAVAVAADGGIVVASHARDKAGQGWWRLELQRLSATGDAEWTRSFAVADAHQTARPGALAKAAGDGWLLGAARFGNGQENESTPLLVRTGPWGHSDCGEAGACGARSLIDCNDAIACTLDVCEAAKGCVHTPRDPLCEDGNLCTKTTCEPGKGCAATPQDNDCKLIGSCELAACQQGKCKTTGVLVDCDDDNPCTRDLCSTSSGCLHTKLTTGAWCRNRKNCKQGTCTAANKCSHHQVLDCFDDEPCTADACTPGKGCQHQALNGVGCNDGDACTSKEGCTQGKCGGGAVKSCGAGKACTAGYCHNANCNTKGLTFTNVSHPAADGEPVIQRIAAYAKTAGFPPDGNPYVGDTACSLKRPVLCFRNWNYAYPSPMSPWSKGEVRATHPVIGCGVTSMGVGNKLCTDKFGAGWIWFHWHISGQVANAWGRLPRGLRGWSLIKDQSTGNCWK